MGWTWERVDGAWEWIQTARHLRRASPMQPMGARNALTLKPSISNTKYEGNTVPVPYRSTGTVATRHGDVIYYIAIAFRHPNSKAVVTTRTCYLPVLYSMIGLYSTIYLHCYCAIPFCRIFHHIGMYKKDVQYLNATMGSSHICILLLIF